MDKEKREGLPFRIQQLMHERAMFSPYEDLRLKSR